MTEQCTRAGRTRKDVLGIPIDAVTLEAALDRILAWARLRESRYVTLCNVHVVVTAQGEPSFGQAIADSDLALPDGMPIAWSLRRMGVKNQQRLSGPDLMLHCCRRAEQQAVPIYLYGSTEQTLQALRVRLGADFPGLVIAGSCSPPFRPPTEAEQQADIATINASGAGLVFVGLGCPKQELWMTANSRKVSGVLLGVGAAFDFAAGLKPRAPLWMQRCGLEWLHRLAMEPRRLWRRYLATNTLFICCTLKHLVRGAALRDVRAQRPGP